METALIVAVGAAVLALATVVAVLRARQPPITATPAKTDNAAEGNCKRCGQRIVVDPTLSRDVFEGMHWLCFHLEFEHSTDPDLPCTDVAGCPWWTIRYYEDRLRQLGLDPGEVRQQGLKQQLNLDAPGRAG